MFAPASVAIVYPNAPALGLLTPFVTVLVMDRPICFSLGATTVSLINLSVTVVMLWSILSMSLGLMKPDIPRRNKASE
ncbi:hypothetical protein AX774_g5036 [Zancudomyces culisetae]|uniref:Uncharacterized protein n=1 Tax=Zancudomyces culisetae TaxID=1213189 RepID=A0A1R1PKM2_ZANCU|nr:hypothetical protein AX774_g5036 [Zancudomyces culisetae]|eukprot:OMH81504.1 hypothetical protein AX774_g5036 [Zancudomyces culisetae]